jgi:hypothetical protein
VVSLESDSPCRTQFTLAPPGHAVTEYSSWHKHNAPTRAQIQCPASRLCSASWQCLDSAPRLEEGRRHILLNSLRTRQASRGRGGGSALRASALALRASKSAALQPGAQACGEWRRLFAARLEVGKRRSSLDHKRAESGGACSRESGGASQCVAAARRVWRRRQGVAAARISSWAARPRRWS